MKATYFLLTLANALLATASPAVQGAQLAAVSEATAVSPLAQDSILLTNPGTQAYCGGLTRAQCDYVCSYYGFLCYGCSSSSCVCTNSGC